MTALRTAEATPGQRLLWLMEHYRGDETPLNVVNCYQIHGPLDRSALREALSALVARHEALRTSYTVRGRRLYQCVHGSGDVELAEERVAGEPDALNAAMLRNARTRHDITVGPFRAALLQTGDEDFVLMLNIHHLSTDGWSGGIISQDLGRLYCPSWAPRQAELAPVPWQFLDFTEWQQDRYRQGVLADSQAFWRERLSGAQSPRLPRSPAIRAGSSGQQPGLAEFALAADVVANFSVLCRKHRTTTFVMALSLFAAAVYLRSGETDLALASMFANRPRPELAGTVGFLANLLVLRLLLEQRPGLCDVITAARDAVLNSLAHQEVPYHLVPQGQNERGAGLENILFQVAAGPEYALCLEGLETTQISPPKGMVSRFDLEFVLMPGSEQIMGQVWFDQRRFTAEWVAELVSDFSLLAAEAVAAPDRPLTEFLPRR